MDTEKATQENFIRFVNEVADETPDRRINHFDWETCAVGDFGREELGLIGYEALQHDLPDALFDGFPRNELGELIGDLGTYGGIEADTYGGLQEVLQKFATGEFA